MKKMSEIQIKKLVEEAIENCPMKTGYADLSQQVEGVKKDVGALKKDVGAVKVDVGGLKKDVAVVRGEVDKISVALLGNGNKYHKQKGIVEKIEYSYKHTKQCVDSKLVERAEPVLKHFVKWEEDEKWVLIGEMMEKYKVGKAISVLLFGSGLLSFINLCAVVINFFNK